MRAKKIQASHYDLLEYYLVFGGVPFYWSLLTRGQSVAQNVDRRLIFNASYHPEWNPKSWKVYAKANESDSWTTIATVTNDNQLSGNAVWYVYPLSVTGRQWQYFRLEVSQNHGGGLMQFAEFEFDKK